MSGILRNGYQNTRGKIGKVIKTHGTDYMNNDSTEYYSKHREPTEKF